MSGINVYPVTARAVLVCNICRDRWESMTFDPVGFNDEVAACKDAWDDGWRVYVGGRGQSTYCPDHRPTVEMRLVYGEGARTS